MSWDMNTVPVRKLFQAAQSLHSIIQFYYSIKFSYIILNRADRSSLNLNANAEQIGMSELSHHERLICL